ncbi:helix-turn-helix domain-containing protein [Sulfurisphaera javensis]|uniref:Helix-turn-helix domain-containing protein n=1 Tax=Sulfurisphaera javensis TaxID=2049879 RepID=A0AAT9GSI5_9CREN
MRELSPSARLVLEIISERKIVKFKDLKEITGLSTRTLRYAIKDLKDKGLIKVLPCLEDAREKLYAVSEIEECYKLSD